MTQQSTITCFDFAQHEVATDPFALWWLSLQTRSQIAGGAPGVSAALESDGDLAAIILSNYDMPIAESVARALSRPLRRALGEAK